MLRYFVNLFINWIIRIIFILFILHIIMIILIPQLSGKLVRKYAFCKFKG